MRLFARQMLCAVAVPKIQEGRGFARSDATFLRVRFLASYIIGTLESGFRKRRPRKKWQPMGSFSGKVALVTGAARGLGRVTAQAFADEGARVVVTDIDEPSGQETLRLVRAVGGEGLFFRAMVKNTVGAYGRLDCAVNNAGVVRFTPIVDETTESFDFHIDRNLRGIFYCMKHEIPQMLKNGGGTIVNQSSSPAIQTESIYATKGGVDGLTNGFT